MALGEMTDAMGDGVDANHTGATVFAADRLRRDSRSSLKLRRDESAWQAQPPPRLFVGDHETSNRLALDESVHNLPDVRDRDAPVEKVIGFD